jgi:hypothetical protein
MRWFAVLLLILYTRRKRPGERMDDAWLPPGILFSASWHSTCYKHNGNFFPFLFVLDETTMIDGVPLDVENN